MPLEKKQPSFLSKIRPSLSVGEFIRLLTKHPRQIIIENPYTGFASVFATVGSLLVAIYIPQWIWVIFSITIIIFVWGLWIDAKKYKLYTQNTLPIPLIINIANKADVYDALSSLCSYIQQNPLYANYLAELEKYLSIRAQDLVFKYEGDIHDTKRLQRFLEWTKHDLERVKRRTPQNSIFYLVYIGPVSTGFLVGSMLAREGMIIFQRSQHNNGYTPVMTVKDRELKEDTTFQRFIVTYPESASHPRVTVAIDAASHRLNLNESSIKEYGDLIFLDIPERNTIGFDEDWLQYCREIFKVLNQAQQSYSEIRLVYSMPVTLGIAVGMAVQHFWNIQLTNYEAQTSSYRDLIKLNEVTFHDI